MILEENLSTNERRIEIKEVFRPNDLVNLGKAILLSRFSFKKHHPKRTINSIYYDTFDYKSLEDSIEGGSLRNKFRIRWYGDSPKETNATLEIKKRRATYLGNSLKELI